jgi:manganese/zinc/iron transport system substrate-binding protein
MGMTELMNTFAGMAENGLAGHESARRLQALVLILALVAGCEQGGEAGTKPTAGSGRKGPLHVVCTIGMIADVAQVVGGDRVRVTGIMGEGVDPHLYKASTADVQLLSGADLILYNGLNLEGKMSDLFVRMAGQGRPTVAVTEGIEPSLLREPPEFAGHYDPHVWFDVSLWMKAVERVRDALAERDPDGRDAFETNTKKYLADLAGLHEECRREIATIPEASRVLITAHDAFGYFGRAYTIAVRGLQGISTESEPSLREVNALVDEIVARKVKAVFVESSVPPKNVEALVEGCRGRGHEVRVGGQLFSDAMGRAGTPEGTYVGMVRHNVRTIVDALK